MALRRLTITLARAMAVAPLARLTVTIIGSISGVRPTATDTANNSASSQSCFVNPLMRKTSGPITMMKQIINQVNRVDASIERGRNVLPRNLVGELPEKCSSTGANDQAGGIAADDVCSHEANIGQVEWGVAVAVIGVRILLGRHGFAGQGGLVDEEILGLKQPQIGRDHVAGGQPHDIAGDQRFDRDFLKIGMPALG